MRAERLGLFVIRATGSSASITNREGFMSRTVGRSPQARPWPPPTVHRTQPEARPAAPERQPEEVEKVSGFP